MNRAPHRVVDAFEARLEPMEIEFHRAYWDSQVHATPGNDERRTQTELELRALKGDPAALDAVEGALGDGMHEPLLTRQLQVLRMSLTSNQMSPSQRQELVEVGSAVESEFAAYRPQVNGKPLSENDVLDILETSDDVDERKRVWLASKEIGHRVSGRVRELARLRNQAALERGYADYYQMALDLQEISEEWLFGVLDRLDGLTRGPFERWKAALDEQLRTRFATGDLRPWHYPDPFFQYLPNTGEELDLDRYFPDRSTAAALALKTFATWGIDLAGVLDRSDLFPRELKCQHAFCLDIDRTGNDVRVLANVVPGERWVEIMLHECGHAAYDISIDGRLPYLLRRPTHIFVTEAMAILSGRLTRHPAWLAEVAGIPTADVDRIADRLTRSSALQSTMFARWVLVMAHFERALYADPETDLDERWWDLVERFQLLTRPEEHVQGAWASKIHIAAAPVYYHNYLLGELLASQLEQTLIERCGGFVGNRAAGDFLKERLFHHGSRGRWDKLIEEALGRPLSPEAFGAQVKV